MKQNTTFDSPSAIALGLLILAAGITVVSIWISGHLSSEPKPAPVKHPINWTDGGEKVGKNVGRTTRGFIKGLWKSGDGK